MDSFRDIIQEQADDVAFPITEHVTPVGWETKVLDGVRIAVGVRHPSRFGRLADICAHTDASPWLNIHVCEFPRALARGTRRYRTSHGILKGAEEAVVAILTTIPVATTFNEQYAFVFEDFCEDIFKQPVKIVKFQSRLGETRFIPSLDLTESWLSGVEQYVVESGNSDKISVGMDASNIESNRLVIAKKLQRMFATIARLHSSGEADFSTISNGSQFTLSMQHEIADRFHVGPAKQSAFLYQLHQEFKEYIFDGGKVLGGWGRIEENNESIVLRTVQVAPRLSERKLAPIVE